MALPSLWRQALADMLGALGTTLLGILFPTSIGAAIFFAGAIDSAKKGGAMTFAAISQSLRDGITSALLSVLLTLGLWALLYARFVVVRAVKNTAALSDARDSQMRVDAIEARLRALLDRAARFSDEQERTLVAALTVIGGHAVIIHYATALVSGAGYVAAQLQKIFERAGWAVTMDAMIGEHPYIQWIDLKIDPQSPTPDHHGRVFEALKTAGIRCGYISDGKVADAVELFIGQVT